MISNVFHSYRKRKPEVKIKAPVVKKIKKEPGVACLLCEERFEKNSFRDAHLSTHHRPLISEYGCSSCHEQFTTIEENASHHEWHSMFNIPHKCLMCDATFEKLITFQRHLSACAHSSYASNVQFSKSFYCDLCSTDFETQNLYDWHDCLIGNNSPCPTCQRVFIKKTVLMKHIFKCTGPPAQLTDVTTKKVGRPKKKNALSNMDKSDIPPQNSIKFEPETIIEQNIDADDGFEAMDNNFMDSHFGDSDTEFDANDSIIPPAQPDINAETTVGTSSLQPSISSTSDSTTTTTNLSTNLHQPLLECRVKLEPLDVSAFANVAQANTTEPSVEATVPPLVVSRPTVPPLTIRIKKEVIHPGYGDDFDADLARNIKQEKSDEIWELANTSREHKKSKNRDKQKKLYKKPALLAIKIKQERMERDDTYDEQYNDMYDSYSMSSSNMSEMTENPTYETNSLPIITQIHSVIESSSINPLIDDVTNQRQTTIIPQVTNQPMTSIPFVPIRIKSEFQKPLSPPPTETSECLSNVNDTATSSSMEVDANHAEMSDAIENEHPNLNKDSQMNECDVNISSGECNNLQPMECQDASESNIGIESSNDISADDKSAENCSVVNEKEKQVAQQNTIENEQEPPPTVDSKSNDDTTVQNEISSEYHDIIQPLVIEKCQEIEAVINEAPINEAIVDSSIEINQHVTTTTFSDHSMEEVAQSKNLEQTANENDENRQIMEVIQPMCDTTENIDADVPNVSASISPIDFNEANDDSLNFIDQLVHEVADTMIPQVSNENENKEAQTENIPSNSTDMQFATDNFSFDVGCSTELVENEGEKRIESSEVTMDDISAADIIEEITKDSANESLLALSDISDIDYNDLLPVLDATESKSNGTDVIANLPVLSDPSDVDGSINQIEPNLLNETEQPKLLHDNSNQQPNCSSNTSNESL